MSRRTSIVKNLTEKFKDIDGTGTFNTNLYSQSYPYLKFWDEVNNFPAIYVVAGQERREYLPGEFKWGFLNLSLKIYTKGDDCQQMLENLMEDVENVIDSNQNLVYDTVNNYITTEILISSITTDEGLLAPYGVGEINLVARYQVMN